MVGGVLQHVVELVAPFWVLPNAGRLHAHGVLTHERVHLPPREHLGLWIR